MTFSFADHVALLNEFLDRRPQAIDRIEHSLLNVRGKDLSRFRDRQHVERLLDACFYGLPGLPTGLVRLKGQLAGSHRADGFELVRLDRHVHELDPLEVAVRAHYHWEHHHWPGRSGRLAHALTVYAVFMLRQLEYLSLRVWDDGLEQARDRLADVQRLVDRLTDATRPEAFVRDARWLMQTAQGPLTPHLAPYFRIARQIAESFEASDRVEIHTAGAKLAGGHLRSQLNYRALELGLAIDAPDVLSITRNSNSMDGALLVGDLVPLLEAYDAASAAGHADARLDLADAILQGLSADPELLLTRLDLLAPSTTIEDLFVDRSDRGDARYTALGDAHRQRLTQYGDLVGRLAARLLDDAWALNPAHVAYSPFGVTYGFCADVLSNIAQSRLAGQPAYGLALEDTFASRTRLDEKLARARGWAALPRREGEREHFGHSIEWASSMFVRVVQALESRARRPGDPNASDRPTARVFVVPSRQDGASPATSAIPTTAASAAAHLLTSDVTRVASGTASFRSRTEMVSDRHEGRFLSSVETNGHWLGLSKVVLTTMTSQGRDVVVPDVPESAIEILRLTCPELVATPEA